ncbi:hypothetical protein FQA47_018325 [Oryzias melastigma]|uniref:Uncharacterized protein n=1 Tax=Oryzias melastigma TaxID=30732 RepID=A0A834FS32_ORYME|nr:hypothetical protein FQA47_018325 [Oryzias melastigma]
MSHLMEGEQVWRRFTAEGGGGGSAHINQKPRPQRDDSTVVAGMGGVSSKEVEWRTELGSPWQPGPLRSATREAECSGEMQGGFTHK